MYDSVSACLVDFAPVPLVNDLTILLAGMNIFRGILVGFDFPNNF